jgi:plasmid maintenance system antidote protein VapI
MLSPMDIIADYIRRHRLTQVEAAKRFGITASILSQILNDKYGVGPRIAKRIVKGSKGEITYNDLYGLKPAKKRA